MRDITSQKIIREVLLKNFPTNKWLDITEVYNLFENNFNNIKPDDFLPLSKRNPQQQWKRNIRVALSRFKHTNIIYWNGNRRYYFPDIENESVEALIKKKIKISEENLWKQLEIKRLIGIDGENYVVKYEQEFLIKNNKNHLAKKVKRISDENVAKGFDIISYDIDGKEKFIEVKTTVTTKSCFEISSNELKKAEELNSSYYLYFINNFSPSKVENSITIFTYSELLDKFEFIPNNFIARIKL
ncbi:MAG: DUF3883 domain-containing protein [Chryseobacterium sp.]|nr:DUF3883 domain-containing protein [Chryseobacterium sp.]